MVRLDVRRQKVIRVETATDGHMWKGWGQFALACRRYAYTKRRAEKVRESETMKSHIPSFLCGMP
jgi:hypothetical protein